MAESFVGPKEGIKEIRDSKLTRRSGRGNYKVHDKTVSVVGEVSGASNSLMKGSTDLSTPLGQVLIGFLL